MIINSTPESVLDVATLEAMTEYKKAAQNIAQKQFSQDMRHLWMPKKDTEPDGISQVQAFVIEGDHKDGKIPEFKNAFELVQFYETQPIDGNGAKVNRRLYIVQNPNSDICELLGVKLGIPPEVFLAHCDDYVDVSFVDDCFARQDQSKYWKVPVPCTRICEPKFVRPGTHSFHTGCIDRGYLEMKEHCGVNILDVRLFNVVSYWAKSYGRDGKSWTAIILVDPDDTCLRFDDPSTGETHFAKLRDFDQPYRFRTEVVMNRTKLETTSQPYARPFFDTLVRAHQAQLERMRQGTANHLEDPFSITLLTQNLVLSAWEEFILRADVNFRVDQVNDQAEHSVPRQETLSTERMLTRDYENMKKYYGWVGRKWAVERWRRQLDTIMDAFNIYQLDANGPLGITRAAPRTADQCQQYESTGTKGKHLSPGNFGIERRDRSWSRLQKKVAELQADIASHMGMFAQRAAFENAFAANRQAKSAGQLTKIATVIVPCTFVASIFSMGGDFAAGEKLFGVYWAVSLPTTLFLLAWILHDDITRDFKQPVSSILNTSNSYLHSAWSALQGGVTVAFHGARRARRRVGGGSLQPSLNRTDSMP